MIGSIVTVPRPRAALSALVLALLMALVPTGTSAAANNSASVPYLALGDSLPYGWDVVTDGFAVPPSFHVGYPETLAARSPLDVTNAACPGETSGSFIDRATPDNGCGFVEAAVGLKADWGGGSQLDFALGFLADNPHTGLVSIQLGANDLFRCQSGEDGDGQPGCTPAEFVEVLNTTTGNLAYSLGAIRAVGYAGPIVLVGYYALDYRDPAQVVISQASAQVLGGLAGSGLFGDVVVADGFGAFEQASRRSGGDPCGAGLLLPLPDGTCDVHTTPDGDRVLAQAVRRAVDLGEIVSTARSGR